MTAVSHENLYCPLSTDRINLLRQADNASKNLFKSSTDNVVEIVVKHA